MEDSLFPRCLDLIKERLHDDRIFGVWFAPITLDDYDESTATVTLRVPSRYVYEYMEQYGVRILQWALQQVVGRQVKIQYRVCEQPTFGQLAEYVKATKGDSARQRIQVAVPDARKRLEDGLRYFLGDGCQWLPAYDEIAAWLQDNKGRGLVCVGTPGLGKTVICRQILPVLLQTGGRTVPCVSGYEMCQRLDELLRERVVVIDDLGKEPVEATVNYVRRRPFYELCNHAERSGSLLIVTTNLSPKPVQDPSFSDSIAHRYGPEVLDRLMAITRGVIFRGESFRHS